MRVTRYTPGGSLIAVPMTKQLDDKRESEYAKDPATVTSVPVDTGCLRYRIVAVRARIIGHGYGAGAVGDL